MDDQLALCRARADKEGWTVVGEHHDRAISGAAGIGEDQRPGLAALLARVAAGGVDQVLAESTDRIARHQGDAFAVRERLEFVGCRLFTLLDGEVNELTGTIKGLFDARFRKDLAARVKRGHRGVLADGRQTGGVAFGYRKVARFDDKGEAIRGLREVDEEKAAIVRRIFREYDAGRSARQIAAALNAEGVAPPRGKLWDAGTLIGHRKTRFGILSNPIYIGELVYGRTRKVVDPVTRQRSFRPGEEQVTAAAPQLRIVDDLLWANVQAQLEARAYTQPHRQRRPKHLLSGLAFCGECGGRLIVVSNPNFACSTRHRGGGCGNGKYIAKRQLETRVLAELKREMLAPDVVAAYLREYHRDHARRSGELTRDRDRLERRLGEATRKFDRLIGIIAEGGGEFAELREALGAARADKDRLAQELAGLDAMPVLTLHPGLADRYREQVEQLETDLADPFAALEAVPRVRALIARVIVTPRSAERRGGVDIEVVRHIDQLLALANERTRRRA